MSRTRMATVYLVVSTISAHAADLNIGPMCVKGVTSTLKTTDVAVANNTQWVRITLQYTKPVDKPSTAKFIILRRAPVDNPALPPNCDRTIKLAKQQGIEILLRGEVRDLLIVGRLGQQSGFWVDSDGKLDVTLGKVTSGLQQVGGGTVDLAGSRLWIKNIGEFLSLQNSINGSFEIEAYKRKISNAKIALPGGTIGTVTLTQTDPEAHNLVLRVNMSNGAAQVWKADLVGDVTNFSGPKLVLPLATLETPKFASKKVSLDVNHGKATGRILDVSGSAAKLVTVPEKAILTASKVPFRVDSLQAAVQQLSASFSFARVAARAFSATSDAAELSSGGTKLVSGKLKGNFAKLSSDSVFGSLIFDRPKTFGLPLEIPDGKARSLVLGLTGMPGQLGLNGSLDTAAFAVGGMSFLQDLLLAFAPAVGAATIDIPINLDLPAASGEFRVSDYDQEATVKATLNELKLKANLQLDISDIVEGSRLDVKANDFRFSVANAVSLKPWLAGTKPGFGNVAVKFSNKVPLVIRKTKPEGTMLVEPDVLLIAEPVLRMGEGATAKRSSLALKAVGAGEFDYQIAERKMILQKAKFQLDDADFRMLDPNGTIDIGGTIVSEPRITLKKFLLDLNRLQNVRHLEATALVIAGTRFDRARIEKTETAFGGTQALPFQAAKIKGFPEFNETSITVDSIEVTGLRFALKDAFLTLGESLTLRDASVVITADSIKSVNEPELNDDGTEKKDTAGNTIWKRREYMQNIAAAANGKITDSEFADNVTLDVPPTIPSLTMAASGRSDKLTGGGVAQISPFSGLYRDNLSFGFRCKDGSNPTTVTESRFTTGGSELLALQINDGQFGIQGALAGLNVIYRSDKAVECDSKSEKVVLVGEQEWWTWGICPTWSEPLRRCPWKTTIPEIAFNYHLRFGFYALAGQASIAAPVLHVRNKKTRFCFVPPVIFNPMAIAMGISPQIEFGNSTPGDAEKLVNGLIHTALVATESTFLTSLGNSIGMAVGGFFTTPQGAILTCTLLSR